MNEREHMHGDQEALVEHYKVLNAIKSEVKRAPIKKAGVRDVFDEQCKKYKESSNAVEFGKMRRNLFRIKQENFPKSPMNFHEIIKLFENEEIKSKFGMSRDNFEEKFYTATVIEDTFAYTLFVSPTICNGIRAMSPSEARNYIVDGTFKVIPVSKAYKQLLIIHIIHNNLVSIYICF